jgi:hypothetical protein
MALSGLGLFLFFRAGEERVRGQTQTARPSAPPEILRNEFSLGSFFQIGRGYQ